jgi:hypothetical protein
MAMLIWSFIHGLCALGISKHISHVKEARDNQLVVDEIMKNTYHTFQAMLERLKD